ncbi:hypothetical protein GMD78_11480 [Ornithinibacillus sp. L9]|uniref:Uncharacterized protein n=1 Tax=Ornithinibacillus caprae TaxID=2678566 RepID=A0A6N8FHS0_9BACI|nr:hypothetical protein [Ornithinibacillus caprae]MUK88995.1 hypothetical protein [Ornithinibacillus caprae]
MGEYYLGAGLQAIGTVLSAISVTPTGFIDKNDQHDLNVLGNTLQATGSALQASGQTTLSSLGNKAQAVGNTTVIYGLLISNSEEQKLILSIKGELIQALGGGISFVSTGGLGNPSFNRIGNLLQAIGNSLQAIGGKQKLQSISKRVVGDDGSFFILIGSWIQAFGAILIALNYIAQE